MSTLGSHIRGLRKRRDLTQEQLATIIHVNRATLANWEVDRAAPDPVTLQRLADYFNVSVDYILGRTDISMPPQKKSKGRDLPPEIDQLVSQAKTLTPAQLKALDHFLATLNNPREAHHSQVADEKTVYHLDLDALVPRDEIGLASAQVKVSEIVGVNGLNEEQEKYLHKKVIEYYGKPVYTGREGRAARRPGGPGQEKTWENDS